MFQCFVSNDQELRCPSDGANMVEQVGFGGSHSVTSWLDEADRGCAQMVLLLLLLVLLVLMLMMMMMITVSRIAEQCLRVKQKNKDEADAFSVCFEECVPVYFLQALFQKGTKKICARATADGSAAGSVGKAMNLARKWHLLEAIVPIEVVTEVASAGISLHADRRQAMLFNAS